MFLCIIGLTTTSTTTTTTITTHKDFSGVWYRTKSVNLEAVIGASGAGFLLRKIAASLPITHTITMNPPILNTIRLQEKAGPIDFDNILTIDSTELKESIGNGKKMLQRIYWEGDSLILQRIFPNENFEMIISRTLDDAINDNNSSHGGNGNSSSSASESKQLVSKIVHRHLKTGNEIEATSWFKYMSPSPNNPPIPDVITTIIEDNEDNNDNDDVSNNDINKKKQIEEEVEAVTSEMNNDIEKTTSTITTTNDGIDSSNKAVAPMSLVSSSVSSTIATTTDVKTTISSTTATTTTTTTATTAATAKNRTSTLLPLPLSSQRYTPAIISRKMVNINHDYNEDDDDLTAVVKMRSFSSSVDFSTGSVLSSSSSLLLLNGDDVQKKPDFSGTWIREGFNISILMMMMMMMMMIMMILLLMMMMMMMTTSSFHDYDFIYIHISRVSINHSIWLSDHSYHQS